MTRVVVTGMGAITPLGNNVEEFWNGIKTGTNGIKELTKFDGSSIKISVAGEVRDFEAKNYMDRKFGKRMDVFSQYGVAASMEALKDSGLDMEKENAERTANDTQEAGQVR